MNRVVECRLKNVGNDTDLYILIRVAPLLASFISANIYHGPNLANSSIEALKVPLGLSVIASELRVSTPCFRGRRNIGTSAESSLLPWKSIGNYGRVF